MNLSSLNVDAIRNTILSNITSLGMAVIGAIALWIIGRMLINLAVGLIGRALDRQRVDPTVNGYVRSTLGVLLNIVLVISLLGYFGIQTTTFAGLLAAAAFAIGTAWSGLLANFAAGAFLVILRPFKQGDFVNAGGVVGTVEEVGLFVTTINTPDNVRTFVGNNRIFSDTVQNFSANPYRRVDLTAQLAHGVNVEAAIGLLKERLSQISNVVRAPQPEVTLLTFTAMGPVLAVRPYCHNDNYWQVYFDTNMTIRKAFGDAGYPVPETHFAVRGPAAGAAGASSVV